VQLAHDVTLGGSRREGQKNLGPPHQTLGTGLTAGNLLQAGPLSCGQLYPREDGERRRNSSGHTGHPFTRIWSLLAHMIPYRCLYEYFCQAPLVETEVLMGEPGAYRLAQALPTIQVPATVQAVLAARIDRLPPEEKRLLHTAAVVGTEVPLPLLQAVAELPEVALHRGLAHLQAAEFLYETRLYPEPDYPFKHALTHEVAYGSLLLERRVGKARRCG